MSFKSPYHFVPVAPPAAAVAEPVFHDVQRTDADPDFWSGELRLTLKALTPLLAGNDQYGYRFLKPDLRADFERLLHDRFEPNQPPAVDDSEERGKKVIEPLRHPDLPGAPVLIPGPALKGMMRQAVQSLLSAPLERVAERDFSFRPNLTDANNFRPALVHAARYDGKRLVGLDVEYAHGNCDGLIYVYSNAHSPLETFLRSSHPIHGWAPRLGPTQSLNHLPIEAPRAILDATVPGVEILRQGHARKLKSEPSASANLGCYALARYLDGADGHATFGRAFNGRSGYSWALVHLEEEQPEVFALPDKVVAQYAATYRHLRDRRHGHLHDHPLRRELQHSEIKECPLQAGDVIFVEHAADDPGRIIGIGHHFRHRRRYRDTIHRDNDPRRASDARFDRLRDLLRPRPLETPRGADPDHPDAPKALSAARLLFGFVGAKGMTYDPSHPNEPLAFGIGRHGSDFNQLAGRVNCNWAMEVVEDGQPRFLNESHGGLVPLRPLGSPKPSAVESYLAQDQHGDRRDRGTIRTYGDEPNDPAAGELAGRKHYLHQPDAATDPACYELLNSTQRDWAITSQQGPTTYHVTGGQAVLARFVSTPGTRFRATIRFRDLRAWELGALLFALEPNAALVQRLADRLGVRGELAEWLGRVPGWQPDTDGTPLLAHKLGHGRPLGLGSVRLSCDALHRLRFDAHSRMPTLTDQEMEPSREALVDALADFLKEHVLGDESTRQRWAKEVLLPWLQVHRYAGRGRFDYPGAPEPIYAFHTEIRKRHSQGRKVARGDKAPPPASDGMKSLNQLDTER